MANIYSPAKYHASGVTLTHFSVVIRITALKCNVTHLHCVFVSAKHFLKQ